MSSESKQNQSGTSELGKFVSSLAQKIGDKPIQMAFRAHSLMLLQRQKVEALVDWDVVHSGHLFLANNTGWKQHDAAIWAKMMKIGQTAFVVSDNSLENVVPDAERAEQWKRHDSAMLSLMIFSPEAKNMKLNAERADKLRARVRQRFVDQRNTKGPRLSFQTFYFEFLSV